MAITLTKTQVSALPGAVVRPGTTAEEVELGEWVYITSDGEVALARANLAATSYSRGMVTAVNRGPGETVAPADWVVDVTVFGPVAGYSDMDEGQTVWLSSATAGSVTQTQPSGAGTWSHPVAYAETSQILFVLPSIASPVSNS